ncbi:MAG UNVERIFIED_CONTAM: hypothetical protein MIO30_20175 [Methylobacterium ajmalii]|nr:hypothetical protein [Methylobacterium ajmalii]
MNAGLPIARSYAREDAEGNLVHVRVLRHPRSGACVQVTRAVEGASLRGSLSGCGAWLRGALRRASGRP